RHRTEEDPRERLHHVLVELPPARLQDRADDVEDVGERRPFLLLAVAGIAEHGRTLLDHDPSVRRLADHLEERAQPAERLLPRVTLTLQSLLDALRRVGLDPLED